jgi:hypothetical protein
MLRKSILALGLLAFAPGCRLMGACLDAEKCAKDDILPDDDGATGNCENTDLTGGWNDLNDNDESYRFNTNCQFTASDDGCSYSGTYTEPASGSFNLTVGVPTGTQTSGCPTQGQYACTYSINSSSQLTLTCNHSSVSYSINTTAERD